MEKLKHHNNFVMFCPICGKTLFDCDSVKSFNECRQDCVDYKMCIKYPDENEDCECDKKDIIRFQQSKIIELEIEMGMLIDNEKTI